MKRMTVLILVILFSAISTNFSYGETLEDRLGEQLSTMKGIKMVQISFSFDEEKNINVANLNIRVNTAYEMSDIQKNSITNFVIYSTEGLTPEDVTLNISEEPIISFTTSQVPYSSMMVEDKLASTIVDTLPVEKAYVNIVSPEKNFLGEYEVMSKAAVLIKLPTDYVYEIEEIFSIVDFLRSSIQDLSLDNILIIDYEGNSLFEIVK